MAKPHRFIAPRVLLNPAARAVLAPSRLGARLFTGLEKIRAGHGNGDALLLDFSHRVFAVADAGERSPAASRILLTRLVEHLAPGSPSTADQWLDAFNAAYAAQAYNHKTTLSAVAVRARFSRSILFIAHGGDSPIFVFNRFTGEVLFRSAPDMDFAGRCPRLTRVHEVAIPTGDFIVIIASDGLRDLSRGLSLESFIRSTLLPLPFDQLLLTAARLHSELSSRANPDDLALLVFDPDRLVNLRHPPLIIGGTTGPQETSHQLRLREGMVLDAWGPAPPSTSACSDP